MNKLIKRVLIFAMGGVAGFFAASVMAKKEYQEQIDALEKELNADLIKRRDKGAKDSSEKTKVVRRPKENEEGMNNPYQNANKEIKKEDREEYKKVTKVYTGDNKGPLVNYTDRIKAEREHPMEEDTTKPYIITVEEFTDEHQEFEKSTVYYYVDDDTLTDENEEMMDDVAGTVGDEALDVFEYDEEGHGQGDVVYVRNEKLAIDYEVVGLFASFKDTIEEKGYNNTPGVPKGK